MDNFLRALKLAIRYRANFIAAVGCAVVVALLWGANLGLVKPMVDLTFSRQSPHAWAKGQIEKAEAAIAAADEQIAELGRQLAAAPAAEKAPLSYQLEAARGDLAAQKIGLRQAQAYAPWIIRLLPDHSFAALGLIVGVLVVATLIKDILLAGNMILVERMSLLAILDLRRMLFRHTLKQDLATFGEDRTSGVLSRFTHDAQQIHAGLNAVLGRVILEPFKMLACLIGAGLICWRLLLLSLLVAPPCAYFIYRLSLSLKRANKRAMEEMSQLYSRVSEAFGGIQSVRAFGMERHERRSFHQRSKLLFSRAMRIAVYNAVARTSAEVMGIVIISLAMLAGAYLVLNQQTSLLWFTITDRPLGAGSLMAFFALLAGVSDPVRKLAEVLNYTQKGMAAADRVYEWIDREPTIQDPAETVLSASKTPVITFDDVSFAYRAGSPVLRNFSLTVPFGKTIAVVGPNGCGKSTLVNLLLRFYDPQTGAVQFDGVDLRQMRLRDVRSRIGLVAQQTVLFDDTVLANIRYGSPAASDEQVIEAARQALAHRFITEKLEKGYETCVGERGNSLSGGQRQRILLARAILRDPQILILDEATSQIDVESEQAIHRALEQFVRGRTTIMITHRVSSLALADEIVVMDGGAVADQGSHEELSQRCELYRRLYQVELKASA